jgi:hypothetical protein
MPQLAKSLTTSAQYMPAALAHAFIEAPHCTVPASVIAVVAHAPLLQPVPDGQTLPHRPQFPLSNIGFEQYCFWPDGSVQTTASAGQTGGGGAVPHVPPKQLSPAAHMFPHAPQFP